MGENFYNWISNFNGCITIGFITICVAVSFHHVHKMVTGKSSTRAIIGILEVFLVGILGVLTLHVYFGEIMSDKHNMSPVTMILFLIVTTFVSIVLYIWGEKYLRPE